MKHILQACHYIIEQQQQISIFRSEELECTEYTYMLILVSPAIEGLKITNTLVISRMSDWSIYQNTVNSNLIVNASKVGDFSLSRDERFWAACREVLVPTERPPLITLPLTVHVARGDGIGANISADECICVLLPLVNQLWSPAGIQFELNGVLCHDWSDNSPPLDIELILSQIKSLCRDHSTGRMTGKDLRRSIFMDQLIGRHRLRPDSYDVWFFDMIGMESQGCCIDRESRTIIMGRRSTKGYDTLTERPIECLAKTCAHELGHALELGHPAGQVFKDGTKCDAFTGRNNLMTGGKDSNGGGGELLCHWQILVARNAAETFLTEHRHSSSSAPPHHAPPS